jgi:2-oxoglutarate dehydrogenase E2 component (dihydrolipoamide succinyltransferase)
MSIELKVPSVGESISEAMIGEWLRKEGDHVEQDEPLVVIETDKVNVELPAPESGTLVKILKGDGEDVSIGEVIGHLEPGEGSGSGSDEKAESGESEKKQADSGKAEQKSEKKKETQDDDTEDGDGEKRVMPAARRALADAGLEASEVRATGPGGRLLKEDVIRHTREEGKAHRGDEGGKPKAADPPPSMGSGSRQEEVVKMTPLRRRVAERLVEAQQTAALLTTFNEIDMSQIIALRKQYQEEFVKRYGIKLGFMSFFVKATIEALKAVPQVNAEVRGESIVYRNYQDIGIAVGGGKGLVVPILRNAERLSFAEVEQGIADFAQRAKANQLKLEELQGGTFTLSNGGIYGSLLSTPIVNPPQSGILGLHKIEERPIALHGEVVIRPMMYVALTYDHRLVDGREAVTFLVKIKERIEDPTRILLEV